MRVSLLLWCGLFKERSDSADAGEKIAHYALLYRPQFRQSGQDSSYLCIVLCDYRKNPALFVYWWHSKQKLPEMFKVDMCKPSTRR